MHPDLARQAEQPQRIIEIEILGRDVLGDRRALRLLALAELDIGAEAPAALRHLEPAVGVRAKRLGPTVGAILRRSEEHTSELQSLMRISYAVFCLKKKTTKPNQNQKPYSITRYKN